MRRRIIIPVVLVLSLITLAAYSYDSSDKSNLIYTWFSGGEKDSLTFKKNTTEALDELEKLIRHYEDNILEIQGKVKVVSSSDDEPEDSKEESFQLVVDKAKYEMKYGTSETIANEKELIVVDHDEKIIFITPIANSAADKPLNAGFFSLSSLKHVMENIHIRTNGRYRILDITMDAASRNGRYEILYDPNSYTIKSIKLSIGYPVPAPPVEPGEDSLVSSADSLVMISSDNEEFNTGHIVIHEQLLVEIHYLNERKVDQHDFKGAKYIDRLNGKADLTEPFNEYRLIK